jgi:Family of unknown function (DUF6188)
MTKCDDRPNAEGNITLPLAGRAVSRCYCDSGFGIQFFEEGPEATIRIEGRFLLNRGNAECQLRGASPSDVGKAMIVMGQIVEQAVASKAGELVVEFSGGLGLRVPSDPYYEPWEFASADGTKIISTPGGGLSIWGPIG